MIIIPAAIVIFLVLLASIAICCRKRRKSYQNLEGQERIDDLNENNAVVIDARKSVNPIADIEPTLSNEDIQEASPSAPYMAI